MMTKKRCMWCKFGFHCGSNGEMAREKVYDECKEIDADDTDKMNHKFERGVQCWRLVLRRVLNI